MIIQAFFGSAQTGVGFQFYDATGALIDSRVTAGIITLPGAGAYVADVTPPGNAIGVYWNTDSDEAHEDLREAMALETITLSAIADAVLDELVNEHTIPGSVGTALAASGASGDPWETLLPGAYAEGTAGAAIGRLNVVPPDTPVAILPDAPDNPDLSLMVLDLGAIDGSGFETASISVELISDIPAKTIEGRLLMTGTVRMDHERQGRFTLNVEKGLQYRVNNQAIFGPNGFEVTPTEDVTYLNNLILPDS